MQSCRRRHGSPSAPPLQFEFDEEERFVPTAAVPVAAAVASPAKAADGSPWDMGFRRWNASNLETEGIVPVPKQAYSFVEKGHPLISLLRHNAENLGFNIDDQLLVDGKFYKVSNEVIASCCHVIRTKILADPAATRDPTQG